MGTIAQKLEYLNDTRLLLKDNINKINNVLTENSTFRSYPQELFNGYLDILNNGTDTLWNNLEKVSQTGTEAVLEGVETAPMKIELSGNTSQETTKGKNLFTGLIKNVRLDPNNGEEFSGSTGATTDFIPVNINSNISYYLSGLVDTIRSFTCAYNSNKEFLGRTSAQTVSEKALTVGSFTAGTPTGTGDIAYIRITQYIQGEGTIDIIDGAKIQLEQGSTATSYEPYTGGQPSPSPDYPQQVKVVKGENVVSVSGKNLISSLGRAGNTIYFNGYNNQEVYPFKAGTYTISYKNSNSVTIYLKEKNGSIVNKGTSKTITFTATEDFNVWFYRSGITTEEFVETQLELGSTATPYVPYSKTDYPINLGDIELCKINTYKDYFHKDNGKWYVHKEIEKVILDGTENWDIQWAAGTRYGYRVPIADLLVSTSNDTIPLLYSNNFIADTQSHIYNAQNIAYGIFRRTNQSQIVIRKDDTTRLADFKTWLSTHNTIVYYVLATPTEEEITNTTLIEQLEAINNAKSVKDKTYITQTNDELPFILDVEAIKEYEVN